MPTRENVDLTGRTIDRYVIVALIRGGAQGRVYRGRDAVLHRHVAIKVVNPDEMRDASARQGLVAEARALSSLNHPNVAGVYDFVTHEDRDFMVMEFIAGATLEDVLAGGPLPVPEVIRLGAQLVRGLAAVHAASIAHCDIKPANLKITSSGVLKIVDFGIAKRLRSSAPPDYTPATAPAVVGTLPYMAPELLRGQHADERSDIYSAGAVLYEMATACRAFPQRTLPTLMTAIEEYDVIAPSRINPAVPPALDRIILKALKKPIAARHQSATELAEALEALTSVAPRAAAPARQPAGRWKQLAAETSRMTWLLKTALLSQRRVFRQASSNV
jgi:serine/threonine protein kinase